MLTMDFYNIIDQELVDILVKYKDDSFLKKHRTAINNQKSYALLIWFLQFYGNISNYVDYITDGDNDSSCDIVFDNIDNQGNRIFYVVQSKWNNQNNAKTEASRDDILKALNDFDTLIRGSKKNINDKLQKKLIDLDAHLKANGEVKFIFLALSIYKGNADDNINSFIQNDDKIKFEVIDINRIKSDYIDRKYKKIEPINPLETYQNPEESPVSIEIIQSSGSIRIEKPFEAYTFLLRPKSIYDLFKKYGFSLFHKNVRNPLLQSQFNEEIERTATDNPAYFWYYNNGITAITYLLPKIGKQAVNINLTGLQIINGAQTVYSIYRAYKNASPAKRIQMDNEAVVTLRLLKSGGKDFDLNVTRYTNSQNPVNDRDFYANDDIQVTLQNASYQTPFWYEKRRSEFRDAPKSIRMISNSVFANVYLAYQLQDPVSVLNNYKQFQKTNKDMNFISHKNHKDGLYEKIFNSHTTFEDMMCAFYIFDTIITIQKSSFKESLESPDFHFLALFKVIFNKYLKSKFGDNINTNKYIISLYEKNDKEIIVKTFNFLISFIYDEFYTDTDKQKTNERLLKFIFQLSHYEKIKDKLEDLQISPEQIEQMVLEPTDTTLNSDEENLS
ncbi:AIPR family protein [Moraxellaceae bacterium AER2_44_116]|nr:AIPR family protein [Moraxellaceae bacterium AER2_44_116]